MRAWRGMLAERPPSRHSRLLHRLCTAAICVIMFGRFWVQWPSQSRAEALRSLPPEHERLLACLTPPLTPPCRPLRSGAGGALSGERGRGLGSPHFRGRTSHLLQLGGGAEMKPAAVPGGVPLPVIFLALAMTHRVANIMLLVPLRAYTYILALVTAAVQLTTYSTVCWLGVRRGTVTGDMRSFALKNASLFAAIGTCEGIFYPLVMYSASHLPGGLVQVLQQMVVPATVLFSVVLLGRRYSAGQLAGVLLVLTGLLLAISVPRLENASWTAWRAAALCVVAYTLLALGVTLKDIAFTRFQRAQGSGGGPGLDVSLVCAAAAVAQLAVQALAWPVLHVLGCIGGAGHLAQGLAALAGASEPLAPLLALVYWSCCIGFSFAALRLVRQASAATVVLVNVTALPLSALVFCCPLPLLQRQAFSWSFVWSLLMVIAGNVLYGWASISKGGSGRR